ncbi:glycosyltransferase family 2 protein [Streptacidiphilus jiangxiensis]|uniref:Glycosyltransferase involved in cell wall bisynthesis n=1 Tax=Streptacidiphilus jiangxiensis TaxID=235985 RepID=A0A1H7MC58_STRJI|nr:glycosyltransferase family A protein [Streptacidiphilus jiangxiensis]SEL08691.1 Glycosyltransferase involved in cell wall bisynthesis [Streptacidiphilus jiangxiensis]
MTPPLVTVITPVHDTRDYLDAWHASLRAQTLDPVELQVVAVDDGSTDGSGAELARLAAAWPGTLTVLTLPDRGGPARARNAALREARGRYVFFLDSDDRLGPEALARLTAAADRTGSDVVVGRVVGVNGRWVSPELFRQTDEDVRFPGASLVWSLSPAKLFRRELVERHGLRFPEDLPVYSDTPFVLEAFFRARRISVLADYDYYYLLARDDRSNITTRSRLADRLRGTAAGVAVATRFAVPGPVRDEVNDRYIRSDLVNLFGRDFLLLEAEERAGLVQAAGELVRSHLTDAIRARCDEPQRLKLHCLQGGFTDELTALVRHECEHGGLPEPVTATASWSADGLRVHTSRALPGLVPEPVTWLSDTVGRVATADETVIPLRELLPRQRSTVRLEASFAGRSVPAQITPDAALTQRKVWLGGHCYRLTPKPGPNGELEVWAARISFRRVIKLRIQRQLHYPGARGTAR